MRSGDFGGSLALFGRGLRVVVETRRWPTALEGVIKKPLEGSRSVILQRCFGFPPAFLGSRRGHGGGVVNDGERASEGCRGKVETAGAMVVGIEPWRSGRGMTTYEDALVDLSLLCLCGMVAQ